MAECQSPLMQDVPASASDGGVSVTVDAGCTGLIASRLAPTVFCVGHGCWNDPNPLWELACQRWRRVCQHWCWMCRPHR